MQLRDPNFQDLLNQAFLFGVAIGLTVGIVLLTMFHGACR